MPPRSEGSLHSEGHFLLGAGARYLSSRNLYEVSFRLYCTNRNVAGRSAQYLACNAIPLQQGIRALFISPAVFLTLMNPGLSIFQQPSAFWPGEGA